MKTASDFPIEFPRGFCSPNESKRQLFETGIHHFCLAALCAILLSLGITRHISDLIKQEGFLNVWAASYFVLGLCCAGLALLPHLPLWFIWTIIAIVLFYVVLALCHCGTALFSLVLPFAVFILVLFIALKLQITWPTSWPTIEKAPLELLPQIFSNARGLAAAGLIVIAGIPFSAFLVFPSSIIKKHFPGEEDGSLAVVNLCRFAALFYVALATPFLIS